MVLFWKQVHLQKEGTAEFIVRVNQSGSGKVSVECFDAMGICDEVRDSDGNSLALANVARTVRNRMASGIRVILCPYSSRMV